MKEDFQLKMELEIPADRVISAYILHSKNIEEQVKKGVEMALTKLCEEDNLAKIVETEVYNSFKNHFNNYNLRSIINEMFDDRLKEFLQNKAKQFADKILKIEDS